MATGTRPTHQAQLEQQIAALSEQVAELTARLEAVEQRQQQLVRPSWWSWWARLRRRIGQDMQEADGPVMLGAGTVAAVLQRGLQSIQETARIYYALFGIVYLSAGLAFLGGMSGLGIYAPWLRLLLALWCVVVGIGNPTCMLFPTLRYQLRMVWLTIGAASVVLALECYAALAAHAPLLVVARAVIWCGLIWWHIAWGRSIPRRIEHRRFTMELLKAAQEKQEQTETGQATAQGLDGGAA